MKQLYRHQAILVVIAGLIFFTNLGSYALFNEDEPKNAACGAEMLQRGDWIVPTFNQDLRTDKPILIYWLMLVSFRLFGVSEFSARLASSLLAVGTTLLTYHLGRKLYSNRVGLLAGIILCTCLMFSAVGRSVTPDSTLVFCVTATFLGYVWVVARKRGGNFSGEIDPESEAQTIHPVNQVDSPSPLDGTTPQLVSLRQLVPSSWKLAAPMFGAMGFAVLAKGPVGLVLPCAIIGLFLLISQRNAGLEHGVLQQPTGKWWRRAPLTLIQIFRPRQSLDAVRELKLLQGLGIVAAIALPWYLTVGIQTNGDWLRGFLLDHNLGRALGAKENHSGFPFYQFYYVVVIHLCCFPWSVFLPPAVYQLWRRFSDHAAWQASDRLLACWAGVWFVCFSIASTKLPNYLLPMYPAISLILARYFVDWEKAEVDEGVYSFNLCCRAMGIVGIVMIIGVTIAAYLLLPNDQWLGLIGVIPLAGAFVAIKFLDQEQRRRVMQTLCATAVLLAFMVVGIAPPRISNYQDGPFFVNEARRLAGTDDIQLATYGYFEPNLVFYARRRVTSLNTPEQVADFLSEHPHPYVITKAAKHNELREVLIGDVSELARHRRFLRFDEMILLGRN